MTTATTEMRDVQAVRHRTRRGALTLALLLLVHTAGFQRAFLVRTGFVLAATAANRLPGKSSAGATT